MGVAIRRLEESDETTSSDCAAAPLNNSLKTYAWANQEKSSIGVTYLAREGFPKKYIRGLPNYDLPLILLARLAVDLRFSGKGIGHALMSKAFRICLRVSGEVG